MFKRKKKHFDRLTEGEEEKRIKAPNAAADPKEYEEQTKINELLQAINNGRIEEAETLVDSGVPCDKPDETFNMTAQSRCNFWFQDDMINSGPLNNQVQHFADSNMLPNRPPVVS